jgi:tripartite-type tricarboxylate transporter receptor subunit TctC
MKETTMKRRAIASLILIAAGTLAGLPPVAAQSKDTYPAKSITLIIPYAPGGISDKVVRTIADELQRKYSMKVIVENRTGGNTVLAAMAVAKAAPDGYTLGWFSSSTFTTLPALTPNLQYKVSDFTPVFMAYRGPIVLTIANNVPASNLTEYVDYIKKSGKPALVGATAKGGAGHIMAASLGRAAKLDTEIVTYRGGPPMTFELVGGQLPSAIDILDTFLPNHQAKKIKIIGHTGTKRLQIIPDVQTFAEAGYPDVRGQFWHGLFAPAGTPKEIVQLLNERFNAALASPTVASKLSPDLEAMSVTPAEFAAHLTRDREYWESAIRANNIVID